MQNNYTMVHSVLKSADFPDCRIFGTSGCDNQREINGASLTSEKKNIFWYRYIKALRTPSLLIQDTDPHWAFDLTIHCPMQLFSVRRSSLILRQVGNFLWFSRWAKKCFFPSQIMEIYFPNVARVVIKTPRVSKMTENTSRNIRKNWKSRKKVEKAAD